MEEPNELAKSIAAVDPMGLKLDNAVKNLFKYKPLLARIIKGTVEECKNMSFEEIEACIEGEIQIDKVVVDTGISNASERIRGLNNELYVNEEGLVRFDLYTYLRLPAKTQDDLIKIYLNLEFMNEDTPGYDLSLRALFYSCRMISMQEGVEFTAHKDDPVKYGNIKKVYSIWVCTESAQKRANTIEKYDVNRSFLLGVNDDDPRYDIINAVIIYISKKHDVGDTDNELVGMLTDIFNEELSNIVKVKKLQDDYGIPMTRELRKEMSEVCTYAEAMVLKGIESERENTLKASRRADAETKRADAETKRADAETKRAEAAENRILELEQRIAELTKNTINT